MCAEPDKVDKKEEKKEAKVEVHDCFDLGPEAAEALETWMKGDANSTADLKVKFFIRSKKISERRELSESDKSDLEKIDFDIRRRTFFVIHGFLSSSNADWIPPMEDALLKLVRYECSIFYAFTLHSTLLFNYRPMVTSSPSTGALSILP